MELPHYLRTLPTEALDILRYFSTITGQYAHTDAIIEGTGLSDRGFGKGIRRLVTKNYLAMDGSQRYRLSEQGARAVLELMAAEAGGLVSSDFAAEDDDEEIELASADWDEGDTESYEVVSSDPEYVPLDDLEWMNVGDSQPIPTLASDDTGQFRSVDDELDWVSEDSQSVEVAADASVVNELDWLNDAVVPAEPADIDWLKDLDAAESATPVAPVTETASAAEPADIDWLQDLDAAESAAPVAPVTETASAAEPADIDWLKDLDEAESAAPVAPVTETASAAEPADIDWLQDLDEAESAAPVVVSEPEMPAPPRLVTRRLIVAVPRVLVSGQPINVFVGFNDVSDDTSDMPEAIDLLLRVQVLNGTPQTPLNMPFRLEKRASHHNVEITAGSAAKTRVRVEVFQVGHDSDDVWSVGGLFVDCDVLATPTGETQPYAAYGSDLMLSVLS